MDSLASKLKMGTFLRIPIPSGQDSGRCRTVTRSEATLELVTCPVQVFQPGALMQIFRRREFSPARSGPENLVPDGGRHRGGSLPICDGGQHGFRGVLSPLAAEQQEDLQLPHLPW